MLGNVVFEKFIDEDVINLSNLYPIKNPNLKS